MMSSSDVGIASRIKVFHSHDGQEDDICCGLCRSVSDNREEEDFATQCGGKCAPYKTEGEREYDYLALKAAFV